MADIQNQLSELLGKKSLEPLQQTIFEKAPQSTFTPPPVANVYQEAKTIFPSPEARIINSGIDWYGLGASAFKLAGQAYEQTVNYLIDTKIAGVKDAQDEAQAKLYDIESKVSVEQYNANHEQRPTDEQSVNKLITEAKQIKTDYKNKIVGILGKDYNSLTSENLDMNTLGSKYQELALTSRGSDRNVDKVYNRMFYQLERVTRGTKQTTETANAWFQGGKRDDKINQNWAFAGLTPIPTANGKPVFGVDVAVDGSWKIKTTQNGIPLLVQANDGYHFNPQAIEVMDYNDCQSLFTISMKTAGNYLFSPSACQLTSDTEHLAQNVAKSNNVNPGMAVWVGTVLSNMPRNMREETIRRMPDLNENERIKLELVANYVEQKLPISNISSIANLDPNVHGSAIQTAIGNYDGLLHPDIYANRSDPTTVASVNRNVDIAVAITNAIDPAYTTDSNRYHVERLGASNLLGTPENNLSIAKLLQDNPEMKPIIIRCMASMEANRNLFMDAGGRVNQDKFNETLGKLIKSELNNSGWIRLDTPNGQTPRFIFNPGLIEFQKTNNLYLHDEQALAALSPEMQKQVKEDPSFRLKMQSTSVLMGNAPETQEAQLALIRTVSPTVDVNMAKDLLDATAATQEKNIANNPATGRVQVSTTLRIGDLIRIAVACTPANMQQINPRALDNDDNKKAAVKQILEDLPTTSPDPNNKQPYPFIDVSFDLGPNSLSNLEASNGGIPIGITRIRGMSEKNTDYLGVMVPQGSQPMGLGMYTPKTNNGPALRINTVQTDENGRTIQNAGEYTENFKRVYHALAGLYPYKPIAVTDAPGGVLPTKETLENLTEATQPYVSKAMLTTFSNPLMQEQLTTADNAIATLRQNGKALDDVVTKDQTLRPVRGLLYEITRIPDPNNPEHYTETTNPSRRILFSDEMLKRLYDRAVANGAKTQADFVTWVLGAMQTYHNNPESLYSRDYKLQNQIGPRFTGPYVTEGKEVGRVLLMPGSSQFVDFVFEELKKGNTFVAGPAPEDSKKIAYYVRGPATTRESLTTPNETGQLNQASSEEVQIAIQNQLQTPGYAVYASPYMLTTPIGKELEQEYNQRMRAKENAAYFYPHASLTAQPTGITLTGQPTAVKQPTPANQKFETTVNGLEQLSTASVIPHDIKDFEGAYRAWVPNQIIYSDPNLPFIDLGKYYVDHNGVLPSSLVGLDPKYYLPGHPNASKEVKDKLGLDPEALAEYRRRQVKEFEELGPHLWFNKRYRDAGVMALRNKLFMSSKVPSDIFNHVNFIVAVKPDYNETQNFGLSKDSWNKLASLNWSPLETEYQLRQAVVSSTDDSINTAISSLNPTEFKLDPAVRTQFVHDLYEAAKKTGKPLTRQQAFDLAENPSFRPDLKRAFFNLWIYPDGYIGQGKKTTRESIIDSLVEQLK